MWDNRSDTAILRNDHDRYVDDASWGRHEHQARGWRILSRTRGACP
ncbi:MULTISPECIES: hypothetical protein [unclassified Streptomyces]|nr:hypothetical protein [Streptomyces sp. NBC_01445]WSE10015.1 hypothetical protein OG574_45805 [Streptomyces sp. NBC_01445]